MSDDESRARRGLRLVRGGRDDGRGSGGVRIVAAPRGRPPFHVDALVVEDDTWFVLGEDPEVRETREHPIRIWTALRETEPATPGTVRVRRGRPLRLLAVVHDLSRDPTWREAWVSLALADALRHVERLALGGVGLETLGAVHGRLPAGRFLELLRAALDSARPAALRRLWLICRPGQHEEVERLLARWSD